MFAREEEPDNCPIVWCVREQKVRATKSPLRSRLLKILIFKKHIIINIYYLPYHTIVFKRAFFFLTQPTLKTWEIHRLEGILI